MIHYDTEFLKILANDPKQMLTIKELAQLLIDARVQVDELQMEIAAARDIMSGNGDKKDPAYTAWYARTRTMEGPHGLGVL